MGAEEMYYPFLRGRQNELLAVKELLQQSMLSENILPIIEPVKLTPTLVNTVESLVDKERKVILIVNPSVGSFISDTKNPKNKGYYDRLTTLVREQKVVLRGIIVDSQTPSRIDAWKMRGIDSEQMVAVCLNPDNVKYYESAFSGTLPCCTVVPYAPSFRRIKKGRVLLDDKFNKKPRNKDYADEPDEFFSDDHLYYENDNYIGFSDYSIVGEEYNESGFAPYAVTIHIVYFDEEQNLRIRHFTSIDNDDISDPAGKFYQALSQLIEWNETMGLNTIAMKQFEKIYREQTYPGLGVVKRLSIMHHLELMGQFLDGENK